MTKFYDKDQLKKFENGIELKITSHDYSIMTNEIKEILDIFYNEYPKEEKQLEDYITNLQEENEGWSKIFDTFSRRPYAHKYLEEKRKELKNDNIVGLDSEMIYKDYYDLQTRIDKAIELIKPGSVSIIQYAIETNGNHQNIKQYLLDILKGEDE